MKILKTEGYAVTSIQVHLNTANIVLLKMLKNQLGESKMSLESLSDIFSSDEQKDITSAIDKAEKFLGSILAGVPELDLDTAEQEMFGDDTSNEPTKVCEKPMSEDIF